MKLKRKNRGAPYIKPKRQRLTYQEHLEELEARKYDRAVTSMAVRRMISGASEAKHYAPFAKEETPKYTEIYTFPFLGNVLQGTGVQNREGDQIELQAVKAMMTFTNAAYSSIGDYVVQYRVLILEHMKQVGLGTGAAWVSSSAGGLNTADLYQQGNHYQYYDGVIDAKLATVHYDKIITLKPPIWYDNPGSKNEVQRSSVVLDINQPIKKKIVFQRGSSVAVGKHNLYCVVIPYCGAPASLGVYPDLGDFTIISDVIFKETLI